MASKHASAQGDDSLFVNQLESSYRLHNDGHASVVHKVTLQSNQAKYYPDNFTINATPNIIQNFSVVSQKGELKYDVSDKGITINFPPSGDPNAATLFEMKYTYLPAATKRGAIWDVALPVFASNEAVKSTSQIYNVVIPEEWGELQMASPAATSVKDFQGERVYTFELNNSNHVDEVHMIYGSAQLYNLELRYPLKNDDSKSRIFVVTFPPNSGSYQKVFAQSIVPEPDSIEIDQDGNVLGKYTLAPGKETEVVFRGQAQVSLLENGQKVEKPTDLDAYTRADTYWESDSIEFKNLSNQLKEPDAIYTYVTSMLQYDHLRALNDTVERLGAFKALQEPDRALCLEYSDVTVALLRAANVPAREVNGYPYIDGQKDGFNPPVADVLHAWVQYWDENRGWVNIDPTWGASTKRDFFHFFDVDHVILAIQGATSTKPLPAGSFRKQNDSRPTVQVTVSDQSEPQYAPIEKWIDNYHFSRLPWWQRLWRRIFG